MFKCKICGEEFEDAGDIGSHLGFGHNLALDTEHPNGLTKQDFPPELQGILNEIDKQREVKR